MDIHKETISIAVMNSAGRVVMECVIETKASLLLDFIHGLRGELQVTRKDLLEAMIVGNSGDGGKILRKGQCW